MSKRKLLPSEYAAIAASFAALLVLLTVTTLPFHATMRTVPVLLQKNGNSPFILKQTIPGDISAIQKRLRIETSIQKEAEKLERQVPRLSRLEATYQNTVQVEDEDNHAEKIMQNRVSSLAEESVDKRAQAVIDLSKAEQELKQSELHRKISSVLDDKAILQREHYTKFAAEAQAAAEEAAGLRAKTARLESAAQARRATADAELDSARQLLLSARKDAAAAAPPAAPAGGPAPLGVRLQRAMARAHRLMHADAVRLARAEWHLKSLSGYQGSTDPVSRLAEEMQA